VKIYTTKSGARVLGVKQDTLKHYALKFGCGSQPGGPGTPWMFTLDDLKDIRSLRTLGERAVRETVEKGEDRDELELGPMYNEDMSPRVGIEN